MDFREHAFHVWAPPGAIWSPWAKPVMFASAPKEVDEETLPAIDVNPAIFPPADGRTALVIDLPAMRSVRIGLVTARFGYRPVPLFNAVPYPRVRDDMGMRGAAVDLWPAAKLMMSSANRLEELHLPADAPPAFLLDSNRRGDGRTRLCEGDFDNRSISLTADFPSAAFLAGAGIEQVLLVCARPTAAEDLAHTLRRWQASGLTLLIRNTSEPGAVLQPLEVPRPPAYRLMFQRWLAALGLRRSPFGGFGAMLPVHYSGGGG